MTKGLPPCVSPACLDKIQAQNDDNEVKKAVEKHMSSSGTSLDALQAAVEKAEQMIKAGAGKRKNQAEIDKWRKKLNTYKSDLQKLPGEIVDADKHYLRLVGWSWPGDPDKKYMGDAAYKNKMLHQYLDEASKKKTAVLMEAAALTKELDTLITNYKSALTYSTKMDDLLEIKQNENKNLHKALKEMQNTTLTNDRRVVYEEKERHSLSTTRQVLYYFYYGLYVLYFIFSSHLGITYTGLTSGGILNNPRFWGYFTADIIYLTLPFWIDWVVRRMFSLYRNVKYLFNNKAPRNVYTSL